MIYKTWHVNILPIACCNHKWMWNVNEEKYHSKNKEHNRNQIHPTKQQRRMQQNNARIVLFIVCSACLTLDEEVDRWTWWIERSHVIDHCPLYPMQCEHCNVDSNEEWTCSYRNHDLGTECMAFMSAKHCPSTHFDPRCLQWFTNLRCKSMWNSKEPMIPIRHKVQWQIWSLVNSTITGSGLVHCMYDKHATCCGENYYVSCRVSIRSNVIETNCNTFTEC